MYLPVKQRKVTWPVPLTKPTNPNNETTDKDRQRKRYTEMNAAQRSPKVAQTPSLSSEKGHPLTLCCTGWAASLICGSHSSPSSCLLNDNPLLSSLRTYHNQLDLWPQILQDPLTPTVVTTDVEKPCHPLIFHEISWDLKVWNNLRGWFI